MGSEFRTKATLGGSAEVVLLHMVISQNHHGLFGGP